MNKYTFLHRMQKKGKIKMVEPSEEIFNSYILKSEDCTKSSKLLLDEGLYENSISLSYYSMYNALTALFFKIGLKCENHTASIILFKIVFKDEDLYDMIKEAKRKE